MDPEEDGYDITDSYVPRWVGAKPVSYLAEDGSSGAAVLLTVEDQNWTLPMDDAGAAGAVSGLRCRQVRVPGRRGGGVRVA